MIRPDRNKDDDERLDIASDKVNLTLLKDELDEIQSDAVEYYDRNQRAWSWWHSRWPGQTWDGYRWNSDENKAWPWDGCSDTRVGTVGKVIGQHATVLKYAFMNMHVQGKSSRPFESAKESARATTLANWMLFTHMIEEVLLELPLLGNWRNGYGAGVLGTDWEQERRIDYIPISLQMLQQFSQQQGGQNGQNGQGSQLMDYIQSAITDPTQEDDMVALVQMLSPIVTKDQARGIVKKLRDMETAQLPIPYIYKSKPRWTALRPMVDVLFPATCDDLQRARWIDRVEWVTETELVDRIETAGYDDGFVGEALKCKGQTLREPWASRTVLERNFYGPYTYGYYNNDAIHDFKERIELHHFYYKCLQRGSPTLYCTVFHVDVEEPAKHGPYGYQHGKYPFDAFRFEKHERPILSSRGIAEIAYTWEQEIKKQRDGRTDLTDLALRPPVFAPYQDTLRIKQSFCPGVIWPERRPNELRLMQPPPIVQSSIEIEHSVEAMVAEYFGLFGADVDPALKQLRQQELADDFIMELKRPVMQMWQLMQQYLPDDQVAQVTGQLSRPFHVDRAHIQGAYDFTLTVDMRELDKDFIKEKMNGIKELMTWDNAGTIDHTAIIRRGFEALDYTLADEAIRNPDATRNHEIEDERRALREIVGSGMDVELPQGANHQLRAQVLQNETQQAMQSNPVFRKKIQETPEIMDVIKNRLQYFQRQMQQQQNAQIGRIQVSQTFSKQAPNLAQPQLPAPQQ